MTMHPSSLYYLSSPLCAVPLFLQPVYLQSSKPTFVNPQGKAVDADQLTDDEWRISSRKALKGFSRLDAKYFIPFFTRKFTRQVKYSTAGSLLLQLIAVVLTLLFPALFFQEVRNAHEEMQRLTSQLYSEVHSDLASEDEAENKL